jgi:predicted PurR-regulated permease PerM
VLIVIFGAVAAWFLMPALLLFFTGMLLAVLLNMPSTWLARRTPLTTPFALILVLAIVAVAVGLGGWWIAPRLIEQVRSLTQVLRESFDRLELFLGQFGWGDQILESVSPTSDLIDTVVSVQSLPRLFTVFSGVFGGIADVLIVLFLGIYLAATPAIYVEGIVGLFPHSRRPRLRHVFASTGEMLRRWLLTRLMDMIVVGGLTGVGLWLLQIPLAPLLGLITGLLAFIPILGTYLAVVPAALVALAQGPTMLLYVLLIYTGAQLLQDYLLSPLVVNRLVTIPPVLMLGSQLLFALLGGLLGVAMAVPIAVVLMVWVKLLYIEDILGDPVDLPSET